MRDLAVLSAVLAGGFGGDKGVHAKKSFMNLLLRITNRKPPAGQDADADLSDLKKNQHSFLQRLMKLGATQKS